MIITTSNLNGDLPNINSNDTDNSLYWKNEDGLTVICPFIQRQIMRATVFHSEIIQPQ